MTNNGVADRHFRIIQYRGQQTFLEMGQKVNILDFVGQGDMVKVKGMYNIRNHLHKFIYYQNTCIVDSNYVQSDFWENQ